MGKIRVQTFALKLKSEFFHHALRRDVGCQRETDDLRQADALERQF